MSWVVPAAIRAQTQCLGKARYDREEKALKGAQRSADRWQCEVFVYPCDICDGWHVATSHKRPGAGFPKPSAVAFPTKVPVNA